MAAGRRHPGAAARRRTCRSTSTTAPRRTFDPDGLDSPREWARVARTRGHALRRAHRPSTTTASRCSTPRSPTSRSRVAVRRRHRARVRRRGARRGLARRPLLLAAATGTTPTTRRSPTRTARTASACRRRPDRRAVGALPRVLFGQVARAADELRPIDVLWFDGGWERHRDEWRSRRAARADPRAAARHPDQRPPPRPGDYDTPEQFVPAEPPAGRVGDVHDDERELGLEPRRHGARSRRAQLVHTLCEVAGRGGNLLLNVGPTGDGTLPPEQVERLDASRAGWQRHGESIVGHDARARALAVLRAVDAPRRPRLPAPAHAAVRHGDRARPPGAARRGRAHLASRRGPGLRDALRHHRRAVQSRSDGRGRDPRAAELVDDLATVLALGDHSGSVGRPVASA